MKCKIGSAVAKPRASPAKLTKPRPNHLSSADPEQQSQPQPLKELLINPYCGLSWINKSHRIFVVFDYFLVIFSASGNNSNVLENHLVVLTPGMKDLVRKICFACVECHI